MLRTGRRADDLREPVVLDFVSFVSLVSFVVLLLDQNFGQGTARYFRFLLCFGHS